MLQSGNYAPVRKAAILLLLCKQTLIFLVCFRAFSIYTRLKP